MVGTRTHAEHTHCDEKIWPVGRTKRLVIMAVGGWKRCRMSNAAGCEVHRLSASGQDF